MRCLVCERFSLIHICKKCQKELLQPTLRKRELIDNFFVYSFYDYSEIEELLYTKYHYIGSYIYKILANNSLRKFALEFHLDAGIVAIDDKISQHGYSHTAILAHSMKSKNLQLRRNTLWANNSVSYAGKSLAFRLSNPRNFIYKGKKEDIILVDDVVTTGTTLKEAYSVVKRAGANPLFALVLADAKR
ncbi:ComF family protein [Nitratiruptor tergarcus]|uniref:Competence protein ComFC n=1 Tax=Nitratiruptor tergarcus DSM 16512 TaxID=1069081 RepID=A0A1W1WS96_9BACT|nr:ComF family protein [Nitratiruptor tergarcus]SMC09116.1 competence protein ComFC [Nitratiruptor tergarcus DSM 16512]